MVGRWLTATAVSAALLIPAAPAVAGQAPGGRIAYVDAWGGTGIYAIDPDGSDRARLVAGERAFLPRWLPDGTGVSFSVRRRWYSFRIDMVDTVGHDRRTLIGPREIPEAWAIGGYAWSPDARRLVVGLWHLKTGMSRLYVMSRNGSSLELIARGAEDPDWSSAGRIVALQEGRVVTMDPDGGNMATVLGDRGNDVPRFSPDGSRIVLTRTVPPRDLADVFVVDADGSDLTNLTRSRDVYDWSPSWAPTGRHIVWAPAPPGDRFAYADLWWMRADGRGRTAITTTKGVDEYRPDWADLPI